MTIPPGASPAAQPAPLALVPLEVWVKPSPGPLLPQVRAALREQAAACVPIGGDTPPAEPLRWAITAVDPQRGLRLEGVLVRGGA